MENQNPKVSIGLPIFNGEKYIKEAIDSILAQSFTDFELIISDNASTDKTEEICREYAAKDLRIRYYRNATNIGGARNHNLTFKLSKGQYFHYAAHDDVIAPNLIEKCVEVLDADLSIILCYSKMIDMDENGNPLNRIPPYNIGVSSDRCERFRSVLKWGHYCESIYGLIRTEVILKTELLPSYPNSDRTFLAELSLYGKFHQLSAHLFFKRIHSDMSVVAYNKNHLRMPWYVPENDSYNKSYFFFEQFKEIIQYFQYYSLHQAHCFRVIANASLNFGEYISCYLYIIKYLWVDFLRDGLAPLCYVFFIKKTQLQAMKKFLSFYS